MMEDLDLLEYKFDTLSEGFFKRGWYANLVTSINDLQKELYDYTGSDYREGKTTVEAYNKRLKEYGISLNRSGISKMLKTIKQNNVEQFRKDRSHGYNKDQSWIMVHYTLFDSSYKSLSEDDCEEIFSSKIYGKEIINQLFGIEYYKSVKESIIAHDYKFMSSSKALFDPSFYENKISFLYNDRKYLKNMIDLLMDLAEWYKQYDLSNDASDRMEAFIYNLIEICRTIFKSNSKDSSWVCSELVDTYIRSPKK